MASTFILLEFHKIFRTTIFRSTLPEVFYKKSVLHIFAKVTGKYLVFESTFNNVAGQQLATLLKKRLQRRSFAVNFAKFLRTLFWRRFVNGCFWLFQNKNYCCCCSYLDWSEVATRGVLWKKVFLEISQNSQETTCSRVSFFNIKLQPPGL